MIANCPDKKAGKARVAKRRGANSLEEGDADPMGDYTAMLGGQDLDAGSVGFDMKSRGRSVLPELHRGRLYKTRGEHRPMQM